MEFSYAIFFTYYSSSIKLRAGLERADDLDAIMILTISDHLQKIMGGARLHSCSQVQTPIPIPPRPPIYKTKVCASQSIELPYMYKPRVTFLRDKEIERR